MLAAGHQVVVHARNVERAAALQDLVQRGAGLVVADLGEREAVRALAVELSGADPLDAVIHNAGVWTGRSVMPVNVVAPYLLTALVHSPRVVYLSSGLHRSGRASLAGVDWRGRRTGSYADSKLFVTTLAAAVARLRPDLLSNAVDPGWVPTRMGGPGAPDDLELGHQTQEWLAVSQDAEATTSGGYWYHGHLHEPHPAVRDVRFQGELLDALVRETGVRLPVG